MLSSSKTCNILKSYYQASEPSQAVKEVKDFPESIRLPETAMEETASAKSRAFAICSSALLYMTVTVDPEWPQELQGCCI